MSLASIHSLATLPLLKYFLGRLYTCKIDHGLGPFLNTPNTGHADDVTVHEQPLTILIEWSYIPLPSQHLESSAKRISDIRSGFFFGRRTA